MKDDWHAEKAGKWTSYWKDETHDPSAPYILTKCLEISGSDRKEIELDIVEEDSIKIMLDGRHLVTLLALPEELRELAAGFLICEGVLKKIEDIRSISVQDDTVFCQSSLDNSELELWTEVRSSGCIGIKSSWEGIEPITSKIRMKKEVLLNAIELIKEKGTIWRRTGGTHSSLICTKEGDIVSFCEDVSRARIISNAGQNMFPFPTPWAENSLKILLQITCLLNSTLLLWTDLLFTAKMFILLNFYLPSSMICDRLCLGNQEVCSKSSFFSVDSPLLSFSN